MPALICHDLAGKCIVQHQYARFALCDEIVHISSRFRYRQCAHRRCPVALRPSPRFCPTISLHHLSLFCPSPSQSAVSHRPGQLVHCHELRLSAWRRCTSTRVQRCIPSRSTVNESKRNFHFASFHLMTIATHLASPFHPKAPHTQQACHGQDAWLLIRAHLMLHALWPASSSVALLPSCHRHVRQRACL